MDASDAVEADIRSRVAKLEQFFDHITACRVVVAAARRRQARSRLFQVHVEMSVPGQVIVVKRGEAASETYADVYIALRDTFDALRRQLQDYVRKLRGDVKVHEAPRHGRVLRLFADDGYGFVETSEGREIYFHRNSVVDGTFEQLQVGSEVRIVVAYDESEKGPQASTVKPIGKHHLID